MHKQSFLSDLNAAPVIAAVKNNEELEESLRSSCRAVFVLYGNLVEISDIVKKIHASGKKAVVHIDLIDGLAARESAVDFIRNTHAYGIISTKGMLIRRAKQLGMIAIQRFFLLDSLALSNIPKQISLNSPDFIEVIPGGMPKIIRELCSATQTPVIAGGLIRDTIDIANALNAGAIALSVSRENLWALNDNITESSPT